MRPIKKGASTGDLSQPILAIGIAFVLVFSAISTIATIQVTAAFAEKGGSGGKGNSSSDHAQNDKSKGQQKTNQTNTNSTNSTESEEDDEGTKGKGKGKNTTSHEPIKPSWVEQLNQTADEIHMKHLKMNAGFTGPYTANLTYTLSANGTADAIGNSTYTGNSTLSLEMSVWKSTPGHVKMDVTNGTLTLNGETMDVHSGHALYQINTHKLLIIAFMTEKGESDDDGGNQTSTTNSTSTDTTEVEDEEGISEPQVRLLKLWITIPEEVDGLPTSELPEPVEITLMSPQSKLASMSFLQMDGEIALST